VGEDLSAFARRVKEQGLAVQVGAFPWGVFGTPRDLMGAENLLIAFYDEPEMIHDMMNHLTGLWIALWTKVAEAVPIAHIHIWEDMSGRNGSLISPDMIRAFMMPCYDRIAAFAAHRQVPLVSVDSDGDVRDLVAIMTAHGVNVFFPFEVQAGCDILEYRRTYPELGILYGLDKRALAGNRGEVEREIARAKTMLDAGRYIPGFDHLIPPDATWENFRFAALAIKELCARPWP
jgi:uroporphyrinogen decarboxylase